MNSLTSIRQSLREDCRRVLELLTTRQYVNPHEPISSAFPQAGIDGDVTDLLARLGLAPTTALGRLTRHDLERASRLAGRAQLGRRVSR
jgi:hypothetical protein